jgi:hypothetical protein
LIDFAEKSVDPIFEIGPFPPNLIDFAEKSAPDSAASDFLFLTEFFNPASEYPTVWLIFIGPFPPNLTDFAEKWLQELDSAASDFLLIF